MGAHVVAAASLIAALFLTTSFSFHATHALLRGPVNKLDPIGRIKARWSAWREKREQERLRKRVEANKVSGRQPVPPQALGSKERKLAAESEKQAQQGAEVEDDDKAVARHVLQIAEMGSTPESAPVQKSAGEPKISRGAAGFRLPSPSLLRCSTPSSAGGGPCRARRRCCIVRSPGRLGYARNQPLRL